MACCGSDIHMYGIGDVGLQIWMKINIDAHVSACSDMLVICQTLHSSAVDFIHYNELYLLCSENVDIVLECFDP